MQPVGLSIATIVYGSLLSLSVLFAAAVSVRENQNRAAGILLATAAALVLPYLAVGVLAFPGKTIAALALMALPLLFTGVLLFPVRNRRRSESDTPTTRIDERTIMFARNRLEPGSPRYETYYRENPEHRLPDEKFRAKPGLLAERSAYHDAYLFAASDASFTAVSAFHPILESRPLPAPVTVDPESVTRFVKAWAQKLGAVSAGITLLRDYHVYSHRGRTEPYGEPIVPDHTHAIAITVEMEREMLNHAPHGPTVMESGQQYLRAGAIAVQLAEFIRNLGYDSRAHIDGNYNVVCPLVARDAGLGEIGRLGLLMTPELGPRVRLAVVTTTLPLKTDSRTRDDSVVDFCTRCRKCATACPANAVPFDDQREIAGVKRWQINQEACYTYWCAVGTDCGRCISVCPYSHPNTLMHNLIRAGVRQSPVFRSLAVRMDDLLYGRNPPPLPVSGWLDVSGRH